MNKKVDRHGIPKVAVKMCNSASCEGSEIGCSRGDCLTSSHHRKSCKWRYITIERFIKLFNRIPHGFEKYINDNLKSKLSC